MFRILIVAFAIASCSFGASTKQSSTIVRPCEHVGNSNKCVGDNLMANSRCSNVDLTAIRQQYKLGQFRFETPYFNASYIDNDLVIQNLNLCYVSEFFFNLASDVAVLAVDCPNLIFASNRTLIQHNSLKEDTTYSFSSKWQYPLIRMTTNIPKADVIDICSAFVFTDVTQMPTFIVSANDEPTKNFLSRDLSFLNIYERETFFYRGFQLMRTFISSAVCNFGCFD